MPGTVGITPDLFMHREAAEHTWGHINATAQLVPGLVDSGAYGEAFAAGQRAVWPDSGSKRIPMPSMPLRPGTRPF